MMLVGIVLYIVGPFLNIPLVWLLERFVVGPLARMVARKAGWTAPSRPVTVALAAALVAGVLFASWWPGYRLYRAECQTQEMPHVYAQTVTDSVYVEPLFVYEAGRMLREGGYRIVEGPDMYKRHPYQRYSLATDGQQTEQPISAPESRYRLSVDFRTPPLDRATTRKTIGDRITGQVLAEAYQAIYHGGPLSILLGRYSLQSCPDLAQEAGRAAFQTFYDLDGIVLRGKTVAGSEPFQSPPIP